MTIVGSKNNMLVIKIDVKKNLKLELISSLSSINPSKKNKLQKNK